jgi:acyl carrier protein
LATEPVKGGERVSDQELKDKVTQIIVQQLGVEADKVTPDSTFIDDLGADSLDIVELIMAFEEEFSIDIPDEDAEKITAVKNVLEYIKAHSAS